MRLGSEARRKGEVGGVDLTGPKPCRGIWAVPRTMCAVEGS